VFYPGLSPLARGTRELIQPFTPRDRFIPAGAGNSACGFLPHAMHQVYPRWRGELYRRGACRYCWGGLSSLARGTLPALQQFGGHCRFIPAGAGNS